MKLPIFSISLLFILLAPSISFAQESTPVQTLKKLFILLDKPDNLINKETNCYAEMEGYDILKLNQPFIKKYLIHLKNTGLFSQGYLAEQATYYQDIQKDIKKDGMGTSRDSDMYTLSQDPPENKKFLAALEKLTPAISGTKATVKFRLKGYPGYKLTYKLVKEHNSWLIDQITSF